MSLDVYLIKNYQDNEIESYNLAEMNHLQVNYAITKEKGYSGSFERFVVSLPNGWRKIANGDNPDYEQPNEEVYWSNITHNLNKMAMEVGFYYAVWRPEEKNITKAKQLIPYLKIGLRKLKGNPKHYEKFNAENGWGLYEHFVPFIQEYLDACEEFPDAEVRVSR